MKLRPLIGIICLSWVAMGGVKALDYPSWSEEDLLNFKNGGKFLGAAVLINGATPETSSSDIVIPDVVIQDPIVYSSGLVHEKTLLSPAELDQYSEVLTKRYLVDPQQFFTKHEAHEVESYLNYHAENADIQMRVLMFGADQGLAVRHGFDEVLHEKFSEQSLTAVIIYYLGDPSRTELVMTGKDASHSYDLSKAHSSAIIKALEKSNPQSQLEALMTQISIELFWLEQSKGESKMAINPEVIGEEVLAEELAPRYAELYSLVAPYIMPAVWTLLGSLVAGLGWYKWQNKKVYVLPVFDIPKRLGADYAAGVGAVITFQNDLVSPSCQRGEEKDFLSDI